MQSATKISIEFGSELTAAQKQSALVAVSHALAPFGGLTCTVDDPDAPVVTEPVGVKKKAAKKKATKKK
jgi:hypothetical protein